MCYEVKCSACGKTTWGGCGRHVASVYKRVPQGQHCLCREWPGVDLTNKPAAEGSTAGEAGGQPQPSSICTVL